MRGEASDAEWFGMEFVIAGRQVRLLTDMRVEVNNADFYDASVSMKLWAIRNVKMFKS